jgi:hypothetical protein
VNRQPRSLVHAARVLADQPGFERLLASTNEVTLFRGGAGTGKSFVLRELAAQVLENGRPVIVLAPQRQQVVDSGAVARSPSASSNNSVRTWAGSSPKVPNSLG